MLQNDPIHTVTESLTLELQRGLLVLLVLNQLDEEQYGYSLKGLLAKQGLEVSEGTLYPLLRRLEEQGLLTSEWRIDGSRPRRYYALSTLGNQVRTELLVEWDSLLEIVTGMLSSNS